MPTTVHWAEIAIRLGVAVAVALAIGYNRSEHGKAAGMRTTVLVCLAATLAMIQVNLLLLTAGRPSDSFVMNDLMRLPLGILTGVGFIGAGAIMRRDNLVLGVTTAATLWLVTVIGLCVGGGQIALGLAGAAIGLAALWALRWVEDLLQREHRAQFSIELEDSGPSEEDIRMRLEMAGLAIVGGQVQIEAIGKRRTIDFELLRLRRSDSTEKPPVIDEFARSPGVLRLKWQE
jgi:putative Mg2+ transporter-C (MgtC) family protein